MRKRNVKKFESFTIDHSPFTIMKKRLLQYGMLAGLFIGAATSCTKILDKAPINQLNTTQTYLNVADADAAVTGLYGKFQGLAERYILLNELRGDMVEYTNNADENLRQLSVHNVSADNPYASVRPFYELILNCNDVLKNFNIMRRDNKMTGAQYDQRYSDVVCLRSFTYLQLGIHWGEVPYITDALESIDAAKDGSRYPKLTFNALLDSLIAVSERIPFKDPYLTGTSLNTSVDGYSTAKFFILKKSLLGDLNLWRGNYLQAATWYRQVMETATPLGSGVGARYYMQYRLGWNTSTEDHYITYSRVNDATSLVTEGSEWRYMFERPQDNGFDYEWIWSIPFDNKFAPENPFVKLFSPIGGSYLLKPSQAAIDYWNSQKQRSISGNISGPGLPYDARGQLSWKNINGQPTVMKYLYNYITNSTGLPVNVLQKNSKWFLYRQTHLHLRFAEAINRLGRNKLAYAFFNSGIPGNYAPPTGITDVTNYQNTLSDSYPFNFDGRNGNAPYFRGDWYRNLGIRGRANVADYVLTATNASDSTTQIEDGLLQENALENGFEGTRWPDMLRLALRRNDGSVLASRIGDKLQKDGVGDAGATRARLMNKTNWYLPFKL